MVRVPHKSTFPMRARASPLSSLLVRASLFQPCWLGEWDVDASGNGTLDEVNISPTNGMGRGFTSH